ncbi:PP2C family protein-serine/threonine phosphatase [Iningainema tapete]|uniref:PP2C family protein-serine/threonine phosphatase n=1 Tax=Iningainema tapete BLCC-T55 TaxID=2748662 RepID=A0A8J6XNC4_9CYAN|nr:PP2C family protein-serine/threonine phosphatase [Iningainema tapete]MBD2774201.1 PP2C family protein-serine/threonine phosphatase [Iningainema tapete BLCC-T55]
MSNEQELLLVYERDLQIARMIQTDFLPETLPQMDGWEIAARFHPARLVAGDFYDVFPLAHHRIGIVIADVCDKGVGAALFMSLFRSLIRAFAQQHYHLSWLDTLTDGSNKLRGQRVEPPRIGTTALKNAVSLTNNYIANNHSRINMFATLFFGVLNPATGLLHYVNGGHEPPAILSLNGIKARLKPTGPAVGIMPNREFGIRQVQLEPGDILVAYSDGVTDARNPQGQFFTEEKLLSLLQQPADSATAVLDCIEASVNAHIANADQFDDITMLAVHRT